jgi:hypothetical protein
MQQKMSTSASQKKIDGEVEELRERMRMLQGDRKSNIETLETHKAMNSSEIKSLREENKSFRAKYSSMKAEEDDVGADAQVVHMKKELMQMRKENDVYSLNSTMKKGKLHVLIDEAHSIDLESRRPTDEDTPITRSIRVLENRLDKAMIKYNESMSIRKTYEQIVLRLREERVGFDNQLSALERTLIAKQRDYEELLLLSGGSVAFQISSPSLFVLSLTPPFLFVSLILASLFAL